MQVLLFQSDLIDSYRTLLFKCDITNTYVLDMLDGDQCCETCETWLVCNKIQSYTMTRRREYGGTLKTQRPSAQMNVGYDLKTCGNMLLYLRK